MTLPGADGGKGFVSSTTVLKSQFIQVMVRHIPQPIRNTAGQLVPLEPEELQVRQPRQLRWYLAGQLVPAQGKAFQAGQAGQAGGYPPGELIVAQVQPRQVAQAP